MQTSFKVFLAAAAATIGLALPVHAQSASAPQTFSYTCSYKSVPFGVSVNINTAFLRFTQLLPFTDSTGTPHNVEFLMLNPRVLTVSLAGNPQDTNSGAPGSTIALPDRAIVCGPIQ